MESKKMYIVVRFDENGKPDFKDDYVLVTQNEREASDYLDERKRQELADNDVLPHAMDRDYTEYVRNSYHEYPFFRSVEFYWMQKAKREIVYRRYDVYMSREEGGWRILEATYYPSLKRVLQEAEKSFFGTRAERIDRTERDEKRTFIFAPKEKVPPTGHRNLTEKERIVARFGNLANQTRYWVDWVNLVDRTRDFEKRVKGDEALIADEVYLRFSALDNKQKAELYGEIKKGLYNYLKDNDGEFGYPETTRSKMHSAVDAYDKFRITENAHRASRIKPRTDEMTFGELCAHVFGNRAIREHDWSEWVAYVQHLLQVSDGLDPYASFYREFQEKCETDAGRALLNVVYNKIKNGFYDYLKNSMGKF
jgi:hypothetical protein